MALANVRHKLFGLAFIGLIVIVPHSSAQPATADAPEIKPGEYWVWQWNDDFRGSNAHEDTYRRTVVRQDKFEGQDVYILSRGDGTFNVVTHDLVTIATIDGANNVKFRFVATGDNQFPLRAGKVYSRHTDNPIGKYRSDTISTVIGMELISTRAGPLRHSVWTSQGTDRCMLVRHIRCVERATLLQLPRGGSRLHTRLTPDTAILRSSCPIRSCRSDWETGKLIHEVRDEGEWLWRSMRKP